MPCVSNTDRHENPCNNSTLNSDNHCVSPSLKHVKTSARSNNVTARHSPPPKLVNVPLSAEHSWRKTLLSASKSAVLAMAEFSDPLVSASPP
jgi:hypothetical protein